MTYHTIDEINSNSIYQPPAAWINPLPTELLNDIKTRNYYNCKPNYLTRMVHKNHCPISWRRYNMEKFSWRGAFDPNDEDYDEDGFFHGEEAYEHPYLCGGSGNLYFEREGIEIMNRTIRPMLVRGNNPTKILFNWDTDGNDDCDHSQARDLKWAKRKLKMNNVKGRSKATTLEKAVKLLMSI
jgi:hypothetical protein